MNITNVISIPGTSGLYKLVSRLKNGSCIVESLVDKKRTVAYASQSIVELDSVSIFTTGEEVPLKMVFLSIFDKEDGGDCISNKLPDAELKAYFLSILPNYDTERVHVSVIKKVLSWYTILKPTGLLAEPEAELSEEDKLRRKNALEFENSQKAKLKDTNNKPLKTAQSKVKAAGVRKSGVA